MSDNAATATATIGSSSPTKVPKKLDEIEFVCQQTIEGQNNQHVDHLIALNAIRNINRAPTAMVAQNVTGKLTPQQRMQEIRQKLPIYKYRNELLAAIQEYQIIIVVGETGSGKSTQIMQYLYESNYCETKKVGCTQPRRVAAMSVAQRVATEMNVQIGAEVGYSIRFNDCTSAKTRIKYLTDGMLLRELLTEPDLASYSVLMLDEAHERTIHTDVLFALLKEICALRPDFKLLISSATLDAEKFASYFNDAPIFIVPGRSFPVDIIYTKQPEADYVDAAVKTILQVHCSQPPGDILAFFSGQEEIESAEELLRLRAKDVDIRMRTSLEMLVLPMYAALPSELQARIFEPSSTKSRKIVLATNIAETSITIDGVVYVIDPGFAKQKTFSPRTGMESLIVTPISRASASQRAGRAGRVAPGKCYRLYTLDSFEKEMKEAQTPEIQRINLCNIVLLLKSLGIDDLVHFDYMDPPPPDTLIQALTQLYSLGALNDSGELTKLGRRMAELPIDPLLAKMLLDSENHGCTEEILTIASMLSVGDAIFYRPKSKAAAADQIHRALSNDHGDHLTLLRVYEDWKDQEYSTDYALSNYIQLRALNRAREIRKQLVNLCKRVNIDVKSSKDELRIRRAITAGFFLHTALLERDGSYRTYKGRMVVHIHPSSTLFRNPPRALIYHELILTKKEYMRQVTAIDSKWLPELAPQFTPASANKK